jgi:hypothetical protein
MQCAFASDIWKVLSSWYGLVIGLASLAAYVGPLVKITVIKCQHLPHTELWVKFRRWRRRACFFGAIGLMQWIAMVIIKANLDAGITTSSGVPKSLEIWVCILGSVCITSVPTILAFLWFYAKTEAGAKDS